MDSTLVPSSFYVRDGDRFISTALTRGPWSNDHQHGGPPAALLGRAVASLDDGAEAFFVARLTIEIVRPVPIAPLSVRATMARAGKQVQRIEAVLTAGDDEVMRAVGLRVRKRDLALPAGHATAAPPAPPPESVEPYTFSFFQHEVGYHRGIEIRFAKGAWGDREVIVWMRTLAPLVEGEPTAPLERVLTLVDAESGACPPLPPGAFTFLNPDLTLYLERPLEGDHLGLSIRSAAQRNGVGIAESALFDASGTFGRSAQSLLVVPR